MKVAVVGSGYVGLVTGTGLAAVGHEVSCIDADPERVARIREGRAPFHEPGLDALLGEQLQKGRLQATDDLEAGLAESEISFLAVGTPSLPSGAIDLRFLRSAASDVGALLPSLPETHVVVVKSTVVPGTTTTTVRPLLARQAGRPVERIRVCANPEFLREGSAVEDFLHPDRIVVGGSDEDAIERLRALYAPFACPFLAMGPEDAELTKYASNALLATLISFSNELAGLSEGLAGTDVETVLAGLRLDRRLSPVVKGARVEPGILDYLRAGSGYGGSCLPKDVAALRTFADASGCETPLLDAVHAVNAARPVQLLGTLEDEIGCLQGRRLAVLGLAFKPGTDDLRDSPATRVVELLLARGARVRGYDPLVRTFAPARGADRFELCGSAAEAVEGSDAALLTTAWPEFRVADWPALSRSMHAPVIVDARGALRGIRLPESLRYRPVGRAPRVVGAGRSETVRA